jgi:hypothetical protein
VVFDEDPSISQRKASMRSVSTNALISAKIKQLLSGRFGILLAIIAFSLVIAIGFAMKKMQELMETNAKKVR